MSWFAAKRARAGAPPGRRLRFGRTMKITHIIAGLSMGGAQMMLYKLLSQLDQTAFAAEVISLTDIGPLDKKIRALGVPVRVLGMRPGVPNPLGLKRLARWLRQDRPHLIQTWMYHADLIGGIAAKLAGGIPVAWNIRHSNLDTKGNKRSSVWTMQSMRLVIAVVAHSDRLLL